MYKNILFAVDFTSKDTETGKLARLLADTFKAELNLIHVVETPLIDIFPDVLNKEILYTTEARKELTKIGKRLSVSKEHQFVEIGYPKVIIPDFIKKNHIDLLIVGHHERKGAYHLLGSTAFALLNQVKCAVLTLPYPAFGK